MKKLTLLVALAGIALAAWTWASPALAVNRLRGAIRSADTEALQEIIDFEAVRENLKADLAAAMETRAGETNSPGPLGAALGGMLVGGLVDTFVTPAGLAALVRGRQPAPGNDNETSIDDLSYTLDRDGFSKFQVQFEAQETDLRPILVFQRRGLGWRVSRIQVQGLEQLVR